jgi:endonuclease YncB( thermonuclease family)
MATTSNAAMRKKTPFHVALFRKQTTRLKQPAYDSLNDWEITMKIVGLLFLFASLPALAQSGISGTVHVMDGNTIHVATDSGTIKVRLQGIAAPENQQAGGDEATAFLEQYAEGEPVRCTLDGTQFRNLEIGICYVARQDIAAAVVRAGLARDCPALSGGRYWAIERPEAQKLPLPGYCTPSTKDVSESPMRHGVLP